MTNVLKSEQFQKSLSKIKDKQFETMIQAIIKQLAINGKNLKNRNVNICKMEYLNLNYIIKAMSQEYYSFMHLKKIVQMMSMQL